MIIKWCYIKDEGKYGKCSFLYRKLQIAFRGVRGVPLLHIRLAVWVRKSPNGAQRSECAFMRILLHENRGVFICTFLRKGHCVFFAPNWRKVY